MNDKPSQRENQWLKTTKCKHGHNYLAHPGCVKDYKPPKILLIDLEVTPTLGWVYEKYETNVLRVEKQWQIMCFSWKWLGQKRIYWMRAEETDMNVALKLKELLNKADWVVGHNGDRFDIKKTNARLLIHGISPPNAYKTLDTLKMARKYFALFSNKLGDIGEVLGYNNKELSHSDLWYDCLNEDKQAWKKMRKYNNYDVELLEKILLRLEPWAKKIR